MNYAEFLEFIEDDRYQLKVREEDKIPLFFFDKWIKTMQDNGAIISLDDRNPPCSHAIMMHRLPLSRKVRLSSETNCGIVKFPVGTYLGEKGEPRRIDLLGFSGGRGSQTATYLIW